jgi:asparagine synthase (glutamine-hydrolysing)
MCGIAGAVALQGKLGKGHERIVRAMAEMIRHRGPDAHAFWASPDGAVMFAHRRLSIIDLSEAANQPFVDEGASGIVFNGEIYNFRDLRSQRLAGVPIRTDGDTEVVMRLMQRTPDTTPEMLRGMFAYGYWDMRTRTFHAARDPLGIKPFYYRVCDGVLYFASEIKALLLASEQAPLDAKGLAEYLVFQLPLTDRTMFEGIRQLLPGSALTLKDGVLETRAYWSADDHFGVGTPSTDPRAVQDQVRSVVRESVEAHLLADVEIGSYISGGIDSTLVAVNAARIGGYRPKLFHGRFLEYPGYDESAYAEDVARQLDAELFIADIGMQDFVSSIGRTIYHLDQPVAGPGALPQYVVSKLAATQVKVVLGGQGGDEIFGGYTRYQIGYLGEALRQAITGEDDPRLPYKLADILPNLSSLRTYLPLTDTYLAGGLSPSFTEKFRRLVDRSHDLADCIDWGIVNRAHAMEAYSQAFAQRKTLREGSYYDAMAAFDLAFLLPGLLQVEDRMSMAHSLESRVPLTDVRVATFAARLDPMTKYPGGLLKGALINAFAEDLPPSILNRKDKMGFPVPLPEWANGPLRDFINDLLTSQAARGRSFINYEAALTRGVSKANSRKLWGMISMELFLREYQDNAADGIFVGERARAFENAAAQMA